MQENKLPHGVAVNYLTFSSASGYIPAILTQSDPFKAQSLRACDNVCAHPLPVWARAGKKIKENLKNESTVVAFVSSWLFCSRICSAQQAPMQMQPLYLLVRVHRQSR